MQDDYPILKLLPDGTLKCMVYGKEYDVEMYGQAFYTGGIQYCEINEGLYNFTVLSKDLSDEDKVVIKLRYG